MSLAAERSFLPLHLPSLYFQVMRPKTLQSTLERVCFHDTSPFPQPSVPRIFILHYACGLEVTDLH